MPISRDKVVWVWYANNHTHELFVLRTVELTVKSALIMNTLLFFTAAAKVEKNKRKVEAKKTRKRKERDKDE